MPLSKASFVLAVLLVGCGPSAGDQDSSAIATGSSSGQLTTSTSETGENMDDLSWLEGTFVASCRDYPSEPYVHECTSGVFHQIEFHPDATQTATQVTCGMPSPQVELGIVEQGEEPGTAAVEPASGFDSIHMVGPAERAVVRRTSDCFTIEVATTSSSGNQFSFYFVRGSFDFIPETEGCYAEAVATEVPQCPTDDAG